MHYIHAPTCLGLSLTQANSSLLVIFALGAKNHQEKRKSTVLPQANTPVSENPNVENLA
ncbi:MAG: hypothetical protein JST60_21080 [Chloroflexi bacterium SZAS-1]|jgi:hypothetical protein|nr:hypothetical protein [Chloroflexi bacterium SZAS-1]